MKRPILTLLTLFIFIVNSISQTNCSIDGPSIVCNNERITINFETEADFTQVKIDAFTVLNGTQVLALKENQTDTSVEIVFLAGGDAEIVIRYMNGNTLTALCNMNVFVFDVDPIPALGSLSNFVEDQITCEALDFSFEMFVICPDCPFYWTLNDEIIEIEQQASVDSVLQLINARLQVEGVGAYTFCHNILKQDSSCYVEDCINIDIVELDILPAFSLDEDESIFCQGSTLQFVNETITEEDVFYIWEVEYDSLKWRYTGEQLEFDFLFSGSYNVSLQYTIVGDPNCISEMTTMTVEISDAPIIPITCSSNSCLDSIYTYQAPIECEDYEWIIDETLGEIISNDNSGVTIRWAEVTEYTETKITLFLGSCSEDACDETFRDIILFPTSVSIDGPSGICDRGTEWYEAAFIPNAGYIWEIEMIDSISGLAPEIVKLEENRVQVDYKSYIGQLSIRVTASIASRDCEASGEFLTTSLIISTNDDLCPGDLFKASVLPNMDEDVVWTLANEDIGYFNQQTISGQSDFFAFDLNTPGEYLLNVASPELGFECGDEIPLTILDLPEVNLVGPSLICPGDSVTYTLAGLGGNDIVEWTIFQNNTATDLVGNEIKVLWIEGGQPYSIKVKRSTVVFEDQICESESFIFDISNISEQNFEISGPEVLCYDAQDTFRVSGFSGEFIWEIEPDYMGTIVAGDSTSEVVIQWHYAPNVPFATLSLSNEVCDIEYTSELDVYFEPYIPILSTPDSICAGLFGKIEVLELETFEIIEIYVDDILVKERSLDHDYLFADTGWVEVRVEVLNPNGCPSEASITKNVYVIPILEFSTSTSLPLAQCPKEDFQTTIASVDYENEEAYYIWTLDGVVVNEGFGNPDLYSFEITKELILADAASLAIRITPPDECPSVRLFPLKYQCEPTRCACIDDVSGHVDYVTPLECNLVNFGASLDLSTVDNPYWNISLPDTLIVIPINGPEDLIQDSFYFDESSTVAQVALRGTCEGVIVTDSGEVLDTATCDFLIDALSADLYSPDFVREYFCNEDLTYDIIFKEKRLRNSSPPYTSTVSWVINGAAYEGITIMLENQVGDTPLNIEMTQCSLDGTYCCTRQYETKVRKEFSPNIILPEGSCENEIWTFTLDVNQNEIVSTLWDFGDGSGSTLLLTEKGFPDNLPHTVSVLVTDNLGCEAIADITVESFPNNIDGEIVFDSDPCAPFASLTYVENSESTITHYNWDINNPMDTSTVIVSNSGNYSVTVTDINGCTEKASVQDIMVNESFANGISFNTENCGVAVVSLFPNPEYAYSWYVNGNPINAGNSLNLVTPGEYEIKVTSTSLSTNEICDSIVENLVIYPNPEMPIIEAEKIFCDPFIMELYLTNYPSATWNSSVDLQQEAASILVSQNGTYNASVVDENGCVASRNFGVNQEKVPFDQLLDQCIQACREDLDSLQITIPGINGFYSDWTWVTVDTFGIEYEVGGSTGLVIPLIITSDMYNYVQLQVTNEECVLRSERIPLDIETCKLPDPPIEIECEPIDSDHASCGQSIYKCLLSEENGGPKLYFEGSVTLPMDAVLCSEDTLSVSLNNGQIVITDLSYEEEDGKIMAFYSANMVIEDADDYKENGTIIKFDFCNEEGEIAYCYEYTLPYRTCNKDFSCLIDYEGISAGSNMNVDVNYCLNLSEVVQDNCTLSQYEIKAIISGDVSVKTIYTQILNDDFDNLHCISIPVSEEDFFGGEYQCIELMIEGDCPGIKCSEFQCGIFGNSHMRALENDSNIGIASEVNIGKNELEVAENEIEKINRNFTVYPNPSTGIATIELDGRSENDWIFLRDVQGKMIMKIQVVKSNIVSLDLSDQLSGLYAVSWIREGEIIETKTLILID